MNSTDVPMNESLRSLVRATVALVLLASLSPARADLISLYRFESSTTADVSGKTGTYSGNTYNGTAVGDAVSLSTDVSGVNGGSKSLSLGGSGDYITLPINSVNPFDGTKSYTITCWFKHPDLAGNNRIILSSARGTTSTDHAMAFFLSAESTEGNLRTDNYFVSQNNVGSGLDDNAWHFGAVTYVPGTGFRLRVDNTYSSTVNFDPAIPSISSDTVIIGDSLNTTFPFPGDWTGLLDDVAIFDHKLSDSELDAVKTGDFSAYLNDSPTASYAGSAVQFDGTDDYISVATGANSLSGAFTVELWVKPDNQTGTLGLIGSRTPSDNSFDVKLQGGSTIHGDIGTGSSWLSIAADATYDYQDGVWFHLAYVVTTSGYTIYVNGSSVASGSFSGTPLLFDSTHSLRIGHTGTGSEYMAGQIDEVRIWNTARTASEIANNYKERLAGSETGLAGYWRFDDGSGTSASDSTSNGNTGTLNSGAAFVASTATINEETVSGTSDVTLTLSGFDAEGDSLSAIITTLPDSTEGKLYQYTFGIRGTEITSVPTTVTDSSSSRFACASLAR